MLTPALLTNIASLATYAQVSIPLGGIRPVCYTHHRRSGHTATSQEPHRVGSITRSNDPLTACQAFLRRDEF